MCRLKSGIILKDRVYVPDIDNHTNMLAELGIKDSVENAERSFVRAELVPPNGDCFAPIESWQYIVDQDILPNWYIAEVDEQRLRKAVEQWAKAHIHIGKKKLTLTEGIHYVSDCQVTAWDSSEVTARDSSEVTAWDSSKVIARDSSEVIAKDSSRIFIENTSSFALENCTLLNKAIVIDWRQNQVICRNDAKWELINKEG